jgi:anhydro-N-acetylmuramic acid kinase
MTYYVIGLMSGSSTDGLDICYATISYVAGKWEYEIQHAVCVPYSTEWKTRLKKAAHISVPEFLRLHTAFGRYCGEQVNLFIEENKLKHKVHFIASHGHTAWHEPLEKTTTQIGDGAAIAAVTGYTTISDLRNMDVALGGQGAPIVPVADRLLFPDYDFCLNLGGIANITVNGPEPLAFDICPANQLLDFFAATKELPFDEKGMLAASGILNESLLTTLNEHAFYQQPAPKSLSNAFSEKEMIPAFVGATAENALSTSVAHIAFQVGKAIRPYCGGQPEYKMLITGGGALNEYLVSTIEKELNRLNLAVSCVVPEEKLVHFKEALAMSMIGVLRWREEENVLASVTGATRNSIGGALWLGA